MIAPAGCPDHRLTSATEPLQIVDDPQSRNDVMKKYLIERHVPGIHKLSPEEYKGAAATSNAALAQLAPRIQWVESYVTEDKTLCVYIAEDEPRIREHSRLSGFPANKIPEVGRKIDPMTAV